MLRTIWAKTYAWLKRDEELPWYVYRWWYPLAGLFFLFMFLHPGNSATVKGDALTALVLLILAIIVSIILRILRWLKLRELPNEGDDV